VVRAAQLGWWWRPIGGGGGAGRWAPGAVGSFFIWKNFLCREPSGLTARVPRASEVALSKEAFAGPAVPSGLCREYSGLCREELALGTTPDSGSVMGHWNLTSQANLFYLSYSRATHVHI
jgi:hypothetical protein